MIASYSLTNDSRAWIVELHQVRLGRKKRASTLRAVLRAFGWEWFLAMVPVMICETSIRLSQPFLVERIVRYLSQSEQTEESMRLTQSEALTAAVLLIVITGIFTSMRHYFFLVGFNLGMRVRAGLTVLIYKKILKMSKSSDIQTNAGQVLNVIANDLWRFEEVSCQFYSVLAGPIMLAVVLWSTYTSFGSACFGGFIVMILFIPFQGLMGRLFTRFRYDISSLSFDACLTYDASFYCTHVGGEQQSLLTEELD